MREGRKEKKRKIKTKMKREYHKQEKAVSLSFSRLLFWKDGREKHRVHWQGRTTSILPIVFFFFFSRFFFFEKTMILFNIINRFLNNPQSFQSRSPLSVCSLLHPPALSKNFSLFCHHLFLKGDLAPSPSPSPNIAFISSPTAQCKQAS